MTVRSITTPDTARVPYGKRQGMSVRRLVESYPGHAEWFRDQTDVSRNHPEFFMELEALLEIRSLRHQLGLD